MRIDEIRAAAGWLEFSNGGESVTRNDEGRFDADTIMMTGELAGLIDDLIVGLGGVVAY